MVLRCRGAGQIEHVVHFVPGRTIVCEKVLQEEGVYGDCTLADYPLYFIPFDSDVLSLELDSAFRVPSCLPLHFSRPSSLHPLRALPHLVSSTARVLVFFWVRLVLQASCFAPRRWERARKLPAMVACLFLHSRGKEGFEGSHSSVGRRLITGVRGAGLACHECCQRCIQAEIDAREACAGCTGRGVRWEGKKGNRGGSRNWRCWGRKAASSRQRGR